VLACACCMLVLQASLNLPNTGVAVTGEETTTTATVPMQGPGLHADPAEAVRALLADHVVAALVLLDQQAALGTLLGVGRPGRGGGGGGGGGLGARGLWTDAE
jgi:hypothetical protein